MAKRLTGFVTVRDDEGTAHTFGPHSKVPKWAADKITNKSAWEDGPDDGDEGPADVLPGDTTREQLVAAAERLNLDVPPRTSKPRLVEMIRDELFAQRRGPADRGVEAPPAAEDADVHVPPGDGPKNG